MSSSPIPTPLAAVWKSRSSTGTSVRVPTEAVNPPPEDVKSTPDLARQWNPVNPPNSKQPMAQSPDR